MDRTRSRCDTISHVKCPPQCPLPELPFGFAKPLHCRGKLDDRCVGIFWVGIALQREKKDPLAKRPRKKRVCFVINSRLNCIQLRSGDDFQINVLEVWWRLCSHSERRYRLSEVIHSRRGQRSGNSLQFRVNIICVNRPEAGAPVRLHCLVRLYWRAFRIAPGERLKSSTRHTMTTPPSSTR
jgi:hypothetical protein